MATNRKPWYVLAVLCGLAAAAIGISINTSGVFYTIVAEDLGILRGAYAFHMTIFLLVTAATTLLVPSVLRLFSLKKVLLFGIIVASLSTAAMGVGQQLWQFYLLAVLRGFSTGLFSVIFLTVVINYWFIDKNGFATSVVFGFAGLIGVIFPSFFTGLITDFGWEVTYVIKGALLFLFCLPSLLFPFALNPVDEGNSPYRSSKTKQTQTESNGYNLRIRGGLILTFLVFSFIPPFISSMPQHLPGYAQSLNYSSQIGASLLSACMLGNILSKIVMGVLNDWIGALKSSFCFLGLTALGLLLLIWADSSLVLLVGSFFLGGSYGLGSVALPLLTRSLFGLVAYQKVFPKVSFVANSGAALAFSVIAYSYDFNQSYLPALYALFGMLLVSFTLLLGIKQAKKL